jgi:hypothetical protein
MKRASNQTSSQLRLNSARDLQRVLVNHENSTTLEQNIHLLEDFNTS